MENWKELYNERLCTAEEAVNLIKSGDHVVFSHCAAEPTVLIDAMIANAAAYRDVTVHHMQTLGPGKYAQPEYKDHFHFDGWFLSPSTRKCVADGYGDVTVSHYYQATEFFEDGTYRDDVMLVMVSPPNEKGYVSIGVSVDYTRPAADNAKLLIAQVNRRMPFTYGNTLIHVSEIDRFVEADQELYELQPPRIGDAEIAIGEYCASLIPDGATISLGIGSIPDAVCRFLGSKKDLGVFSDMFSDGLIDLYENGVINNKYCTTDPGVMTVSFVMGTRRLYDFVDRNPAVNFQTAEYVNHPYMISRQSQMCIVNSSVGVDLMGQVVSASIGEYQFSGVGGQPSLTRGATMAPDRKGKGIIAMTASVPDFSGKLVSKITPFIAHGAEVSMTREDVSYVVTEFGIAKLKGKSLEDRARELIAIADPKFQDELIEEYEKRFKKRFHKFVK